jgi:hypothetical protein
VRQTGARRILRASARVDRIDQRIVSWTVVVAIVVPLVPVIVSVTVLRDALPDALTVSVELAPVAFAGLNVPTTPD